MDERQKIILILTSIGSFLTPFMGSSINIAIPEIGHEFLSSAILLSWVTTSYLLTSAILIVPMGRLADIRGRVGIFLSGVAIYTAGSLICTIAPSAEWLIVFRIIQGIGGAMLYATSIAIITSVFHAKERGMALGINVAFIYTGLTIGPFLGGIVTEFFGWRSIFYLNVLIGLFVLLAGMKYLKVPEIKEEMTRFDLPGSVLYAVTIFLLMIGFQELPSEPGIVLFALAGVSFIAFVYQENRAEYPVIRLSLFTKNRVFAFSNLAALINYSSTYAIGFLLSIYLQNVKGFSPFSAGTILIAQPIMQALFSPAMGKLSDKYPSRLLATAGMAMITIGLVPFANLGLETSVTFIIADLAFLGLGYALFSSPNTHAVMDSVNERCYGVASGILGTMRLSGMMVSMGISMFAFSLTIGRDPLSITDLAGLVSAIEIAFAIFAALCALGTIASYVRNPKKQNRTEDSS
ncbi:MFS transporter [Methanoplanus sp. FWC-SCC4]|uniref:MFS transporter n=1 Tax=Methanochimaera problematica TaxID=2609417 RepID=A0AA97FCP8_9EURY|nr:MFS transporter [Methanoplanus sp. FWC-SCC4]WOF17065.1 MFS transporter [Methanoplanus sp. FWC-SCC4]